MIGSLMSASLGTSALIIFAVAVWAMELQRKEMVGPSAIVRRILLNLSRFEIVGLAMCTALVIVLCTRQRHNGFESIPDGDTNLWQEITNEWPMLMTADSLLSIQSMLRLIVLLSALLRGGAALGTTPLLPECASFMLCASICRLALIGLSPFDTYHLDGPLGGAVYVMFEVAAFPLLLLLSHGMIYQGARGFSVLTGGVMFSLLIAKYHQFQLADDAHLDVLFSMGLIFELPAAACFLVRSCATALAATAPTTKHSFAGFAHLALPIQQGLSLYFLLVGLAPPLETPEAIMRKGHPFECMWATGAAQVVMYLLAGVAHFASSTDEPEAEAYSESFLVSV